MGYHASPAFADLDDDGDLDALVGSNGNTIFFENVELGPGCADAADPNERSNRPCDNGLDDDGDGKADWRGDGTGDPQCVDLLDNREAPLPPTGCGLGPELLLRAPLLAAARRRPSSAAPRPRREA